MQGRLVYLDTSSIAKRYIDERGTKVIDRVYSDSEAGSLKVAFSIWNIGEAVGVFDRYHVRGLISDEEFKRARANLISESLKMSRLESLTILPMTSMALADSWSLVTKHHIYVADALQISSSKMASADLFLGADRRLLEVAAAEGLKSVNVESNPEEALRSVI
ncbi:MAG: type II toxin-antitoxin system VapC family toxin [Candidatus Bathyarchaeia archaeon]|jgi:predicted nucleic acid-binding protein